MGVLRPSAPQSLDEAGAEGNPPAPLHLCSPGSRLPPSLSEEGRHWEGEVSPHQTEKHQATESAKFLISIIKACSFLPMDVPSESLHQRNDLCKELLHLQVAYHSGLRVSKAVPPLTAAFVEPGPGCSAGRRFLWHITPVTDGESNSGAGKPGRPVCCPVHVTRPGNARSLLQGVPGLVTPGAPHHPP